MRPWNIPIRYVIEILHLDNIYCTFKNIERYDIWRLIVYFKTRFSKKMCKKIIVYTRKNSKSNGIHSAHLVYRKKCEKLPSQFVIYKKMQHQWSRFFIKLCILLSTLRYLLRNFYCIVFSFFFCLFIYICHVRVALIFHIMKTTITLIKNNVIDLLLEKLINDKFINLHIKVLQIIHDDAFHRDHEFIIELVLFNFYEF